MKTAVKKKKIPAAVGNVFYPVAALGVVLAVWAVVSAAKDLPLLVPGLDEIFTELGRVLSRGETWRAIGLTAGRVAGSFALSFLFAAVLAALGTVFKPLHRFLSPIVTVLQAAPTMAVILVVAVWLERGEVPLLIGFLICFPLLYNAMHTAIAGVDAELLQMAEVYRIRPSDRLTGIYLPSVLPAVFDGGRSAVSLCVKVVIAAEVLAQTAGSIGIEMQRASVVYEMARLMAWTLIAIVMSFAFEGVVVALKKLWERRRELCRLTKRTQSKDAA